DVMCLLVRRYVRQVERMKIEGEDGEKTSSDEMLKRLIERLGVKVDKKLDELQFKMSRLEREVDSVRSEEGKALVLQKEHFDRFVEFSGRKTTEGDKYAHMLDEAKLQILSRMDSERIQMERVLEHRVGTLVRKLDESTRLLSQQVDKLQGAKGLGSAPGSPSRSKFTKAIRYFFDYSLRFTKAIRYFFDYSLRFTKAIRYFFDYSLRFTKAIRYFFDYSLRFTKAIRYFFDYSLRFTRPIRYFFDYSLRFTKAIRYLFDTYSS
ncbi:hypothetical protein Btru_030428, partial [Bulinus truncatus]